MEGGNGANNVSEITLLKRNCVRYAHFVTAFQLFILQFNFLPINDGVDFGVTEFNGV